MMCHNETAKKDQRGAIKDNPLRDQHILQTDKRDYYRLSNSNILLSRVERNANLLSPDKKTAYIKNNKSTKNYKWDVKQLTPSIPRWQQQDENRSSSSSSCTVIIRRIPQK